MKTAELETRNDCIIEAFCIWFCEWEESGQQRRDCILQRETEDERQDLSDRDRAPGNWENRMSQSKVGNRLQVQPSSTPRWRDPTPQSQSLWSDFGESVADLETSPHFTQSLNPFMQFGMPVTSPGWQDSITYFYSPYHENVWQGTILWDSLLFETELN
jgi:hypothetical protein